MIPRLIHLIYLPWDKDQKLLADEHAFDHGPYERLQRYAPDFEVRLWTRSAVFDFCRAEYPAIADLLPTLARPTMMVDVLRWLVVYHFGGVYWQYDMNPLVPMARFLPGEGKEARLFTECVVDADWCAESAKEPIRQGVPEEPVRLCNQAFAATPKQAFIKKTLDLIVERSSTLKPKRDYDILYICANAAVSTAYNQWGKDDPAVELMSLEQTRSMIKIMYRGSWRTERGRPETGDQRPETGDWKSALLKFPGVRPLMHRWVKPHAHEEGFGIRDSGYGMRDAGSSCGGGKRDALMDELRRRNVKSVLECSVSGCSIFGTEGLPDMTLRVTTPVRKFLTPTPNRNRTRNLNPDPDYDYEYDYDYEAKYTERRIRFFNPMYSRFPRVDAVILVDYFDHIPNADVLTILQRLRLAGVPWFVTTDYPLLNVNWDTYVGEWRPLNLALKPYELGQPLWSTPDPDSERRSDRALVLIRL